MKSVALLGLALFLLAGCSNKPAVNTYETANPVAQIARVEYEEVIMDGEREDWIDVKEIRRAKTKDGYERVQVFVKNMEEFWVRFRYRFDWYDENGMSVVDPDNDRWTSRTMSPGDDEVLNAVAPKKTCADFKVRLKFIASGEED